MSPPIPLKLCLTEFLATGTLVGYPPNFVATHCMAPTFESFLGSVGVSGPEAQTLTAVHEAKSSTALALACQVAKHSIGRNNVDTAPVNRTLLSENW
jgi:hypothetical protein